jgi:hypothetical protein
MEGSGSDADGETNGSETDGSASEPGELSGTCLVYPKANATADVFLGRGAVPGNTCELEVTACGGDAVGNWGIETSCGSDYPLPTNPFETEPSVRGSCFQQPGKEVIDWFKDLFGAE